MPLRLFKPTPKTKTLSPPSNPAPLTSPQAAESLSEISAALRASDAPRCRRLASRLLARSLESERNRSCLSSAGASPVLAAVFEKFPSESTLSALAALPLDDEARQLLSSDQSLRSIVSVLLNGSPAGRFQAVAITKELSSADPRRIAAADGLIEAVVGLIKEPASPQATKATIAAAFCLVNSAASKLAESGMVSVLLELVVDCEKGVCEKGLVLLDAILGSEEGREMAAGHALAVPVLVKKMFRVSDLATEFAVSALWKLCKMGRDGDRCLKVGLQVGAFQKLLLLLQVGCSDAAKERASELLRMMNGFRATEECIDIADFRGLKRPF